MIKIPFSQRKRIRLIDEKLVNKRKIMYKIIDCVYDEFNLSYKSHPLPEIKLFIDSFNSKSSSEPEEHSIYISNCRFVYESEWDKIEQQYKFIREFAHEATHVIVNNTLTSIFKGVDEILTVAYEMDIFNRHFSNQFSEELIRKAEKDYFFPIIQKGQQIFYAVNENYNTYSYKAINKYGILLTGIFQNEIKTLYTTSESQLLNESSFITFAKSVNEFIDSMKGKESLSYELYQAVNDHFMSFLKEQYLKNKVELNTIADNLRREPIFFYIPYPYSTPLPKQIEVLTDRIFMSYIHES